MSHVIPCRDLARASRSRLRNRITDKLKAIAKLAPGSEAQERECCEVGKLIHTESLFRFSTVETPMQLQPAPWLHVIKRLVEEAPEFEGQSQSLLGTVQMYLDHLVAAKTA